MRLRGFVISFSLFATLASGSPGAGFVLCVGPDNHFALEVKEAKVACAGCPDDEVETSGAPSQPSLATGDCPCVDVTLGSASLASRPESPKRLTIDFPVVPAVLPSVRIPVLSERARDAWWTPTPSSASPLFHHRAVVLLV
jgi:hypothetical protein